MTLIRCNCLQPARYNANGQPNKVGQREYVWDALGRLVQVRQGNHNLAHYRYSHRGERIGKTIDGKTTHYLYSEARQLSAELDDQGRITREYLYLADHPITVIGTLNGPPLSTQELSANTQLVQDAALIVKGLSRTRAHLAGGGAGCDGIAKQCAARHAAGQAVECLLRVDGSGRQALLGAAQAFGVATLAVGWRCH